MARKTVAQLDAEMAARNAEMDAKIDKLLAVVEALTTQDKPEKKNLQPVPDKPKRKIEWLADFPDYGTPAQRVEYDKLAKRAVAQRDKIAAAMGVEYVSCFIPVSKKQDVMPHSIKWAARYSK